MTIEMNQWGGTQYDRKITYSRQNLDGSTSHFYGKHGEILAHLDATRNFALSNIPELR